jgi:Fe-S-cluster containining protein
MAASLGIDAPTFLQDFAEYSEYEESWLLQEVKRGRQYDCIMFNPAKGTCATYLARPTQCRTFPFWPENLSNAKSWERLKGKGNWSCEGIGKGPLVSASKIKDQISLQNSGEQ